MVANVDQQFDHLQADAAEAAASVKRRDDGTPTHLEDRYVNSNLSNLHDAIQELSQSSQSRASLKRADTLRNFLGRVKLVPIQNEGGQQSQVKSLSYDGQRDGLSVLSEQERLEWVVLGKVTTRVSLNVYFLILP